MQTGKMALMTVVVTLSLAAGCGQSEIKTYRVAKEEKPALPAAPAGHASAAALPHIHGDIPGGWEEQARDGMRAASFQIRGDGSRLAQMAVIPMPGATGIELQSINLWREELGLPQLTAETFQSEAKSIAVGDSKGHFFEMAGNTPRQGEAFKRGTLGVVFEREGTLWFAKMTGESTLVAEQKENFQKYLKSLEFHSGSHGAQAAAAPARPSEDPHAGQPVSANTGKLPPGSNQPKWSPPAHWKEKTPGPMVTVAYTVEAGGAGQADVTISRLSGDGGGMAGNVNRWRGQLGLPPASEAEIQKSVGMLEVDGAKNAYLADLKGTNARSGKAARMLAVGVPRGGEAWFYKLMGDEAVVEKEKDAFVKFVTTAY